MSHVQVLHTIEESIFITSGHVSVVGECLVQLIQVVKFSNVINLLAPELFFFNFSTPVYKMWIIQEPNTLELWNKLHFEGEKTESIYHV